MWFAKISIIFFIFCFGILFFAMYMNTIFNDPCLTNTATISEINGITANVYADANSTNFNQNLVFGDFLSTWTLLKNILTGVTFQDVVGNGGVLSCAAWGGLDTSFSILVSAMFYMSVVFMLIYIISFRSV